MRGKRREGEGGGRIEAMALASVCIHTYTRKRVCAKNAVSDDLFFPFFVLLLSACLVCLRSIPFSFFFL